MSPEQSLAKRGPVDHRTDIYSLGATLYELLTLEPVYDGRDRHELLRQIAVEEPRPLRSVCKACARAIWKRSSSRRWRRPRKSVTPRPRSWPTTWDGS